MKKLLAALPFFVALACMCASASAQKPLRMGSSAMAPTIEQGAELRIDLLAYAQSPPARWDIVTFRRPDGKSFPTLRIVGLPGDTVSYGQDKRLQINGVAVTLTQIDLDKPPEHPGESTFVESLQGERHLIQIREGAQAVMMGEVQAFAWREQCTYTQGGFICKVPPEHVFVMGDNRDSSRDSRYIGFIPQENIAGRVDNARPVPGEAPKVPGNQG